MQELGEHEVNDLYSVFRAQALIKESIILILSFFVIEKYKFLTIFVLLFTRSEIM